MAYIRAAQAGNFSSPSTWVGGVVPSTGDIACSGSFRVTLDVTNVLASISETNTDWVTGGGTNLAVTHTGGFDIPNGQTITIHEYRYGYRRSAATTAANAGLSMSNGNATITVARYVEEATIYNSKYAMWVAATTTSDVHIDIGTLYLRSSNNTSYVSCRFMNISSLANVTNASLTLGDVMPETGEYAGTAGISASNISAINFTLNVNGKVYLSYTSQYVLDIDSGPSCNSVAYINYPQCGYGSFTSYNSITDFYNVFFTNGVTNVSTINNGIAWYLNGTRNKIQIDGDIDFSTYSSKYGGGVQCSDGTADIEINGDIIKTAAGFTSAQTMLNFAGCTGHLTINGDIIYGYPTSAVSNTGLIKIPYGGMTLTMNNDFVHGGIGGQTIFDSTTYVSFPFPVTINGNIDYSSAASYTSSAMVTGYNAFFYSSGTASAGPITINGNITGHNNVIGGENQLSSVIVIGSTYASGNSDIVINGNLTPGNVGGCIAQSSSTYTGNIVVNGTVSGVSHSWDTSTGSIFAVFAGNADIFANKIISGPNGDIPVYGKLRFAPYSTGYIVVKDENLVERTLSETPTVVPSASDVRYGVATGETTGTLVVPQAPTVMNGVVYDNGTTGTLDVFNGPNYVTETRTASQDGNWSSTATWGGQSVPTQSTFVYTNGKQVTVDGTVECAGLADTSVTGGLILDASGNAALVAAYGDPLYDSVEYISKLDGNSLNSSNGTYTGTISGSIPPVYSSTHSTGGSTQALYFRDTTNGYLDIPIPALSTGVKITIEFWVYLDPSFPVTGNRYFAWTNSSSSYNILGRRNGNVEIGAHMYTTSGTFATASPNPPLGQWIHVAFVRKSNIWYWYENGTMIYSNTSQATVAASTWKFFSGVNYWGAGHNIRGWASHVRITYNQARYSGSTISPPALPFMQYAPAPGSTLSGRIVLGTDGAVIQSGNNPLNVRTGILQTLISKIFHAEDSNASNISNILNTTDQFAFTVDGVVADSGTTGGADYTSRFDTIDGEVLAVKLQTDKLNFTPNSVSVDSILDPYFSDVILLMDNEGDNDSTVFTDLTTTATLTNAGTPKISTSFKKFGVSSAYFDGASRVDASVINMSSFSHWTIDMWVYMPATVAGSQTLIGSWNGTSTLSWHIGLSSTGVPLIEVSNSGVYEGANSVLAASAITLAEWHMITMTKNGSIYKLYVDGVAVITLNGPASIYNSGAGINLGARNDLSQPFTGYIDSVRITKNVVRQVLDFTVPITDFPGTTSVSPELSYYVSTNATGGGGGDCDLTPVTSSLATLSNDVGTVSSNVNLIKSKTDQLAFTSGNVNSHPDNTTDTTAIKVQTDQLTFTAQGVVADASVSVGTVDFTPVTDAIADVQTDVTAIKGTTDQVTFTGGNINSHPDNTADTTAIKAKTDQLAFTASGVVADSSGSTTSVDLTPVTNALTDMQVDVDAIRENTDKMNFTGVEIGTANDPNWANVSLLLHGDGVNGSTSIIDKVGNTVTANGNAQISTVKSKFGTGSIYFGGTGDYLNSSSTGYDVDATDFTIECFVNISSFAAYNGVFMLGNNTLNNNRIQVDILTTGEVGFYAEQNPGVTAWSLRGTTQLQTDTWYHLAFVRSGGSVYMYVDGILEISGTVALDADVSNALLIGSARKASAPIYFSGYIDEFRITKGLARYTTNFPVPVTEFGTNSSSIIEEHINAMPDVSADLTSIESLVTLLGVNIASIKAKTDQLIFLVDGVQASAGGTLGTDFAGDIAEIDALLTAIKTKTDNLTFTTGVNAKTILP